MFECSWPQPVQYARSLPQPVQYISSSSPFVEYACSEAGLEPDAFNDIGRGPYQVDLIIYSFDHTASSTETLRSGVKRGTHTCSLRVNWPQPHPMEYSFDSRHGIKSDGASNKHKQCPSLCIQTVPLGYTKRTNSTWKYVLQRLAERFHPRAYDVITCNCQTFCETAWYLLSDQEVPVPPNYSYKQELPLSIVTDWPLQSKHILVPQSAQELATIIATHDSAAVLHMDTADLGDQIASNLWVEFELLSVVSEAAIRERRAAFVLVCHDAFAASPPARPSEMRLEGFVQGKMLSFLTSPDLQSLVWLVSTTLSRVCTIHPHQQLADQMRSISPMIPLRTATFASAPNFRKELETLDEDIAQLPLGPVDKVVARDQLIRLQFNVIGVLFNPPKTPRESDLSLAAAHDDWTRANDILVSLLPTRVVGPLINMLRYGYSQDAHVPGWGIDVDKKEQWNLLLVILGTVGNAINIDLYGTSEPTTPRKVLISTCQLIANALHRLQWSQHIDLPLLYGPFDDILRTVLVEQLGPAPNVEAFDEMQQAAVVALHNLSLVRLPPCAEVLDVDDGVLRRLDKWAPQEDRSDESPLGRCVLDWTMWLGFALRRWLEVHNAATCLAADPLRTLQMMLSIMARITYKAKNFMDIVRVVEQSDILESLCRVQAGMGKQSEELEVSVKRPILEVKIICAHLLMLYAIRDDKF